MLFLDKSYLLVFFTPKYQKIGNNLLFRAYDYYDTSL